MIAAVLYEVFASVQSANSLKKEKIQNRSDTEMRETLN